MISTYKQAIDYIFSLTSLDGETYTPGIHLQRIKKFLNKVGNPQDSYPTIHITGTAGKGSTSYLCASIFKELGYKVGLHTSPFLVSLNEKFQVLSKKKLPLQKIKPKGTYQCTDQDLIMLTNWFIRNRKKYEDDENEPLTFYEAVIAMVFKYFKIQKVDIAVIEVGMGGRLDATNVINSEIAILNSVGLDHTEFLGNTLEKITWDKMHIMKPDKIFISGLRKAKLNQIVQKHSKKLNTKVFTIGKNFNYKITESGLEGLNFQYKSQNSNIQNFHLNLIGDFQAHNACLAIQAAEKYIQKNVTKLSKNSFWASIKKAFNNTYLKARFHIIQKNPLIIFDGAHNEIKMKKFTESFQNYLTNKEIELLFSCKYSKDMETMLSYLAKLDIKKIYVAEFVKKYYTKITSYTNQEIKKQMRQVFGNKIKINTFKKPYNAFKKFKNNLPLKRVGVVTGSLYLLGKIYEKL